MSDQNDHDLLITLCTKVDILLNRLVDIPQKCVMHDENQKNIISRVDKLEETVTWTYRFSIGTAITIGLAIIGLLIKVIAG